MEEIWAGINWTFFTGVLDIFLVYLLIYRALLLVRGTRAQTMLLGLGIIGVFYVISRELELLALNWILGNFLGSVILVVVVLFQDDLRRALMKVGLAPGFGPNAPSTMEVVIREVARAATELSRRRLGALIVIKREVGLEDYTEHSVQVDATVSHQVLLSIFLKGSPLHDGAVIIENGRLVVAGAVLPLSFNHTTGNTYGTRHRAALGLAEHTDAIIVVVSEETGVISLVREGRITADFDEKSLTNALYRLTLLRSKRRQREGQGRRWFAKTPGVTTEGGGSEDKAAEKGPPVGEERKS